MVQTQLTTEQKNSQETQKKTVEISPEQEIKTLESENTKLKTQLDLSHLKEQLPVFRQEILAMAKPDQEILTYLETQQSYKEYMKGKKSVSNSKKMVLFLQCALNQWDNSNSLKVDGAYGMFTLGKLQRFCKEKGLNFDGSVTITHIEALKKLVNAGTSSVPSEEEILPPVVARTWLDQSMLAEGEQTMVSPERILEINRTLQDREQGYINPEPQPPSNKTVFDLMRIDAQFLKSEHKEALLKKIDEVEGKVKEVEEIEGGFEKVRSIYKTLAPDGSHCKIGKYEVFDSWKLHGDGRRELVFILDGKEVCRYYSNIGERKIFYEKSLVIGKQNLTIVGGGDGYQYVFDSQRLNATIKNIIKECSLDK